MELHQLRCFLAVVKEGGFNKATGRMQMTQPALSYQIRQLEMELGTSLFHRRPGGVSPTESGRLLALHAEAVMESVQRARHAIDELSEGMLGEVRIGTFSSVGVHLFPQVIGAIREKFPTIKPSVLYRHSNVIIELLTSSKIDVALMINPKADKRFRRETVIEERLYLVCGRKHELFGQDSIGAGELKKQQFISLPMDTVTGQLIRDHLAKLGVNAEPVVSTNNIETAKKMVEMGLGLAFLPELVISADVVTANNPHGSLRILEVGPALTCKVAIVTWKHVEMSKTIRTFTEAFVDELRAQFKLYRIEPPVDPATSDGLKWVDEPGDEEAEEAAREPDRTIQGRVPRAGCHPGRRSARRATVVR